MSYLSVAEIRRAGGLGGSPVFETLAVSGEQSNAAEVYHRNTAQRIVDF